MALQASLCKMNAKIGAQQWIAGRGCPDHVSVSAANGKPMSSELHNLSSALAEQGYATWRAIPARSIVQAMHGVASHLGGEPLAGRGGKTFERLKVLAPSEAPARSLSRLSGVHAQPWHVDGSHLTTPPRYIILGCEAVAAEGAPPTQLLRIKDSAISGPASRLETFAVRNGRASFYATVAGVNRPWIRFDPGCMVPKTTRGQALLDGMESVPVEPMVSVEWEAGKLLIIDNWAMLHRRGDGRQYFERSLLRISLRHSHASC
jgi:hypothetical protein